MGVYPHCYPDPHLASAGAGCRSLPQGAPHSSTQRTCCMAVRTSFCGALMLQGLMQGI